MPQAWRARHDRFGTAPKGAAKLQPLLAVCNADEQSDTQSENKRRDQE